MRQDFPGIDMLSRAQGCLLGQFAGDMWGRLVEFQTPEKIRWEYPKGGRELADGCTWNAIAGQPTDDSEILLSLARILVNQGKCNPPRKPGNRIPFGWSPVTSFIGEKI